MGLYFDNFIAFADVRNILVSNDFCKDDDEMFTSKSTARRN